MGLYTLWKNDRRAGWAAILLLGTLTVAVDKRFDHRVRIHAVSREQDGCSGHVMRSAVGARIARAIEDHDCAKAALREGHDVAYKRRAGGLEIFLGQGSIPRRSRQNEPGGGRQGINARPSTLASRGLPVDSSPLCAPASAAHDADRRTGRDCRVGEESTGVDEWRGSIGGDRRVGRSWLHPRRVHATRCGRRAGTGTAGG